MYCLWNGEYGEHDLDFYGTKSCAEKNIQRMEAEYKKYPGMIIGDFTCVKVEYDWGKHDQRWTVKCNLCGEISYRYHAQDWRRGKGQKTYCHCRKDAIEAEKLAKKKANEEKILENKKAAIGKEFGDWKIVEYNGFSTCSIVCKQCGKTRKHIKLSDLECGKLFACNHKIPHDYSGEEWIGRKEGHLTTIGRDGMMFIAKCDCGEIVRVRATDLFTSKRKVSCSSPDCIYCSQHEKEAREKHKIGFKYEREIESELKSLGLNAHKTQDCSDYGVDIIIYNEDGTKTAIQCKKQSSPSGVGAIQEVYSGGRFYDCEKFAVINEKGFSPQACNMAKKLGIYLCEGKFEYPEDIEQYANDLLPTHKFVNLNEKLYEIDGEKKTLSDWGAKYGVPPSIIKSRMRRGYHLKNALTIPYHEQETFIVNGFRGSKTEICKRHGISVATANYRMKHYGVSFSEAVLMSKQKVGRPKKKQSAPGQKIQTASKRRTRRMPVQTDDSTEQLMIQDF